MNEVSLCIVVEWGLWSFSKQILLITDLEAPVSHRWKLFFTIYCVCNSAISLSLIYIWMILVDGLASHKSKSSEPSLRSPRYVFMDVSPLFVSFSCAILDFICWVSLRVFWVIHCAFFEVCIHVFLMDFGSCVCTYLVIFWLIWLSG